MTTSPSRSASIETLTLIGRLRGARGLVLFVLLFLFAVGLTARQFVFVRGEISAPDVGFLTGPRADGQALLAGKTRWEGLLQGDELVAVDAEPVSFDSWQRVRVRLSPGPHTLTLRREGRDFTVSGVVEPASGGYGFALVLRLLTGAVLFLFGFGSFLLRPGGTTSWLFMMLMVTVGTLSMVTGGNAGFIPSLYTVIVVALSLGPGLGLHLFMLFPEPLPVVAKRSWVAVAVHVPGLLFALITVVQQLRTGVAIGVVQAGQLNLELITRLWSFFAIVLIVGVVFAQWRRHAKAGNARLSSQYRLLALGIAFGLLLPAVLAGLARALGTSQIYGQLSVSGIIVFALLMGVVLVRHNPLDIDRYAASVVGYVLTLGLLGGAFGLSLVALPLIVNRLGGASSSEALVVLTAVTFLSVGTAYRRLRKTIDRWFSREQANALQTAEMLRSVVDAVQQQSREKALEVILDAARVLGGEQVALWQVDASGRNFMRVLWRGGPEEVQLVPRQGPFAAVLERPAGVAGLAPTSAQADVQQALWAQGLAMTAPIRAHSVPVAALGVGRRVSGFGYRAEDLAFLETLAAQAGLALERGQVVTQIGRYRVERRLASGGMAEIFVAWQLGLGGFERKVALKRLLPEFAEDPRYAAGLLDEARIAARLHHRNIAQTFEVGLEEGQHFIAMEFVDGPPLRALMAAARRRGEPVPVDVALAIARGLLQALHHAHEITDVNGQPLGVVHRDVTPANLLVSNEGEPKLVDFGLVFANARLFRTQTGIARGTLPYMSPEQGAGSTVDRRADVYSAGATLYELFTGVRAFPEGPLGPRPLAASTHRAELSGAFDLVLEQALAIEPAGRHATAAVFCEVLLAALPNVTPASEPVVAAWVKGLLAVASGLVEPSREEQRTATVSAPPKIAAPVS